MNRFRMLAVVVAVTAVVAVVLWSRPAGHPAHHADIHESMLTAVGDPEVPGRDMDADRVSSPPESGMDTVGLSPADIDDAEVSFVRHGTVYLGPLVDLSGDEFRAMARQLQSRTGAIEVDHYAQVLSAVERLDGVRSGQVLIEAFGCGRVVCMLVAEARSTRTLEWFLVETSRVIQSPTWGWTPVAVGGFPPTTTGADVRLILVNVSDDRTVISSGAPADDQ